MSVFFTLTIDRDVLAPAVSAALTISNAANYIAAPGVAVKLLLRAELQGQKNMQQENF